MENDEEVLVESTVVKTVRNLKRKQSAKHQNEAKSISDIDNGKENQTMASTLFETYAKNTINIDAFTKKSRSIETDKPQFVTALKGNGETIFTTQGSFKRPIPPPKSNNNTTKFGQTTYPQASKTTKDVNFFDNQNQGIILNMVDIVFNKGKEIKELVENNTISKAYISQNIIQDRHFIICFTNFLDKMLKKGEVNNELKNLSKSAFSKIEKFVINKLEGKIKMHTIKAQLDEVTRNAFLLVEKRAEILQRKISSSHIYA